MKILHTVESYLPARHGMQEVVAQISERLTRRGHEVTVATSVHPDRREAVINGVRVEGFALSGNMVNGYQGGAEEQRRYQRFLMDGGFDIVVNFAAQQWATDLAFSALDAIPTKKVLVPTGFSGLHLERYRDYFRRMPEWMRRYDAHVFLSETYRDIRFAEEHGIENRVLIPNGAGEEEFAVDAPFSLRERLGIPAAAFLVLLVGSHTGTKGHREAVRIFDAARMSDAVLLIVGSYGEEPLPLRGIVPWVRKAARRILRRVQDECPAFCRKAEVAFNGTETWRRDRKVLLMRSLGRQETVQAYREADLFLFPSRIECSPIVLFESVAAGTPFLATDVGNATEIAQWTGGGAIIPTRIDEKGFSHADIMGGARMLEEMWRDATRRRKMGEAGRAAWRERFTWGKIAERYERLYDGLLRREAR